MQYLGDKTKLNFRSFSDMANAISTNLHKVPGDVDLVVGIPRSGLLAASIVALELNLPLTHVGGFIAGEVFESGRTRVMRHPFSDPSESKHALLLDDSVLSGETLFEARSRLVRARPNLKLTSAAVFAAPNARDKVDFYFEVCPTPRLFAWNYMHRPGLSDCCVDIDGVLCRDPTSEENDEGPAYLSFLRSASALRVPTYEVGWLVTARLEKYRPQTEDWLNRHNVRYRELVMLDNYTAEERRRSGIHGKFKASVYSAVGAHLFIESNAMQARQIARLSGKPVLCVETQQLVDPNMISLPYGRQLLIRVTRKAKRVLSGLSLPVVK